MSNHVKYKFSVSIRTGDLAVVNCLRALSQYSQKTGVNRIPWGNTKDSDWKRAGNEVTFHFTTPAYREGFISEAHRLLPNDLWLEVRRSDQDPAQPARKK